MGKRRTRQTPHAEGEHGPRTEARIIEQLQSGTSVPAGAELVEHDRQLTSRQGKRRLVEGRQQHDEAEKNSEWVGHRISTREGTR